MLYVQRQLIHRLTMNNHENNNQPSTMDECILKIHFKNNVRAVNQTRHSQVMNSK